MGYTFANSKTTALTTQSNINNTPNNQGGLIGGLGYVFNKFGLNFVRSFEGIWDYAAGGIADLFGADKWAERQFANDWLNYNHADEWYNPGEGWKVAGDIGGGIGSMGPSLVALAAAGAMTYFSGGSAAPAAIALVKAAGMTGLGLSAAGGATKEAFEESGELGAKQYGYGALVGATELAMEKVTAGIGVGTGRLYKNIGSNVAKNTAKTVSKSLVKNGAVKVAAKLGADFASEAFEEGFSEFISPYYKRLTYDPNAENASIQEISYAALIGGMSGLLMTGSAGAINTTSNYISGNKAVNADNASKIIETARKYADYENNNSTGYEAMSKLQEVIAAYDKSVANNGVTNNAYQKMLIGQMQKLNTLAQISPFAERSAEKVLSDKEGTVKYLNENSYTNSKGQPFTVSDLTAGIDMTDMTSKEGHKRYLKSLRKAMSSNPDLAFAIAVDATGGIFMDAKAMSEGALSGRQFNSSAELQEFVEKSNDKDIEALSKILKTDIRSGDVDAVNKAIESARINGVQDVLSAKGKKAKKIPHRYNANHADGAERYSTDDGRVNFAIIKRDEKYIVYDYMTESSAEFPSLQKLNAFLADINKDISENGTKNIGIDRLSIGEEASSGDTTTNTNAEPTSEITRKVFKLASKVEGYAKLNENNKRTVRGVMRQALAHGVSEDVAVDIASVAARSGAKIRFNKEACRVTKKDGTIAYANGKYSKTTDTITLNPDAKNKIDVILLHELLHNMIAAKSGKRTYAKLAKRAKASMPEADRKTLEDRYASYNITDGKVIAEEITTHYGETLTNRAFIKALVAEDASIIERIVDFFTKAKSDYAGSEKLSRSAKKFLRAYKKMFAEFSAKNQNTNAYGEVIKWKAGDEERFSFGVTQQDIDEYVDNAYENKNNKDYLPYSSVSQKLINDVAYEIDISGYSHALRDNDIRHIRNSHGEQTNEKYPVTKDDLSKIPYIINNYDKVFVKTNASGKPGIVYVKVGENNVIYYVEAVTQEYHNEKLLVNKQMIKAGIDYIPNLFGLEKAINKKESSSQYLADLQGIREAYVQDVKENYSKNSIYDSAEKINPSDKNSSDRLSLPDEEYLTAVEKGDMITAQRLVDDAAKKAGYTDKLYHGTHQFGFTEFDPAFSDDKISIFAAGNDELAQTYSGRYGARKISDTYKLDGLTIEEVVKKLNKESNESYEGRELKTEYEIMHLSDVNKLIDEVNLGIEELQETVEVKIKEYADRMAKDFNDKDQRTHSKLIELNEALEYYRYEQMSTPIYVLLHYTDAFNGSKDIAELEYKIRLMNKLTHADTRDGIIVKKDLDGYGISLLYFDEARAELKSLRSAGNYALYGKPTGQLVIDGKGQVWNNIRNWVKSVYYTQEGTTAERKGDYFRLYDNKSGNEIFHGRIAVNETNANMSIDYLKPIMVQKANNVLAIRAEYMHTTRDIARFAKDNGYESVKFENLVDNGGNGESVGAGDVYAYFNPNNLKSADPVTYDYDGKIIPLSKRFNPEDPDIRYSLPDEDVNSPTLENVAKEREQYKPGPKDKFFTAWDNFQIEAVDETYGIQKYLIKNGGEARADVEALVQLSRASRTRANEMIGSSQYDLFTRKKLGDGLEVIYKPINDKGEEYVGKFEDYLLHLLNIDRMTLHERTQAEYDAIALELSEINEQIEAKKKRIEYLAKHKQKQKVKTARAELKELKAKSKALNEKLAANPVLDDKPVFGENAERAQAITAEESRKIVEKYEAKYPEFKETRDKLYAFLQNLQNMRVEAGLISQESADRMAKLYPHYVPSMRDTSYGGTSAVYGERNLAVSSTIKSAKGGGQDILSIEKSIADQVIRTVEAIDVNRLLKAVYDAAVKSGDNIYVRIEDTENTSETQDTEYNKRYSSIELRPTNNQITFFIDGKQTTMKVSKEIYLGFKGLTNSSLEGGVITQGLAKLNKAFKMGVTTLNPLFGIRNVVRDLQDAGLNSKHPKLFLKNLPLAINDMIHNSEEWQLYRAMGGFSSTVYENGEIRSSGKRGFEAFEKIFDGSDNTPEQIFKKLKKSGKNLFRGITMANEFLEQMTRFAEFKASLEAGDSAEIALNNSAEVTTNFGRHGRLTKIANSTIMPFLNASVQGFDKIFRNMRDAIGAGDAEKIAQALAQLLLKAMLIGVVPMLLNIFMYGGDDDYESLRDDLKESYFLIRISEGKFIRIPRGRLAGVIGGAFNRSYIAAKGGDPDIKGYLGDVVSQVTPVENMSRTIFAPFKDVSTNTTWYGGEIEGREFENVAPGERYDESTSSIAIAIGKALNYSPKKIHYLLDQYSGVIGDLVLPATTKKAEKGFWSGNFVTDSATSNRLSSDFYKLYDEAKYAKSAGDDTAIYQLKHLNKVRDAVSKLRDEKEAIENDDSLSDKEKRAEVRAVQILINQLYDTALKDYPAYTRAVEQTASIPDEKLRYVATTKLMYGAEAALEVYNKDVYEKASLISKANISFDDYYDYYFTVKSIEADVDKNGNTVDGSRRKKVVSAISKMKLRNEQKLLLICASGFSVADGDIKGMSKKRAKTALLKYILSLKISVEDREKLAKMCGFEAKNGRIYIKK